MGFATGNEVPLHVNQQFLASSFGTVPDVSVVCVGSRSIATNPSAAAIAAGADAGPVFVRVSAANEFGMSAAVASYPPSLRPASTAPSRPTRVRMEPAGEEDIKVSWEDPEANGGAPVTRFSIEWDTVLSFDSGRNGEPMGSSFVLASIANPVSDVQTVTVGCNDHTLGGTFALIASGQRTQ